MNTAKRYRWFAGYALLLAVSTVLRFVGSTDERADDFSQKMSVPEYRGTEPTGRMITVAYSVAKGSKAAKPKLPIVLLHGNPSTKEEFAGLLRSWEGGSKVIAVDLPGFGESTRRIADHSFKAQASAVRHWLDEVVPERFHLLGSGMGGGVALHIVTAWPDRVASLTLLSSIGVQEFELFGEYRLNHLLHHLQNAGAWLLRNGIPHMGLLDRGPTSRSFTRAFLDSDQRPMRALLEEIEIPVWIVHGRRDTFVSVETAVEHHRIVPQSKLDLLDEKHFIARAEPEWLAEHLSGFTRDVEAGRASRRADAGEARLARAELALDRDAVPAVSGWPLVVLLTLLALATFLSEDLTCVAAGILVADGRLGFAAATSGCLIGIFVGDVGLYLIGRLVGVRIVRRRPFRWFVSPAGLQRATLWFDRYGVWMIVLSRFIPGMRLPTYVAAGVAQTRSIRFLICFAIAAFIWTPALVYLAYLSGERVLEWLEAIQGAIAWVLLATVPAYVLVRHLFIPMATHRGRRLLWGRWLRVRRWEFWSPWIFYLPVAAYVIVLGIRHRSLTLFSLANPGLEDGGFIGESKSEILAGLGDRAPEVARWRLVSDEDRSAREAALQDFVSGLEGGFPLVLKPDVGERGRQVLIARSLEEAKRHLRRHRVPMILQDFVGGEEFGVFYARRPDEENGCIISLTRKQLPRVEGDGKRSIAHLMLDDARAPALFQNYVDQLKEEIHRIPSRGESVRLVDVGSHCRGAIFLDGEDLITPELCSEIDRISKSIDGFFFGRYDLRAPSEDDLRQGKNLRILEINGVTSEATHIYDPNHGLLEAYRVLFAQWKLAFEIGAIHRARGHRPPSLLRLLKKVLARLG